MKSERETLEMLSAVSTVKMSAEQQMELWFNIESQLTHVKSQPRKVAHMRKFGTSAAAIAAVAILAVGVYVLSNRSPNHNIATQNTMEPFTPKAKFSVPSSLQSVRIASDSANQTLWTTPNPNAVEQHVLSWLKKSTVYEGTIPKSQFHGVFSAYVGPAALYMETWGTSQIIIYPAYYNVKNNQTGAYQIRYVQDVIAYKTGSHITYLNSPQLFAWLKNDDWKAEFTNPYDADYTKIGNLELGAPMSSVLKFYGPPDTKTTAHGEGGPEWIYPKQGIIAFGEPLWQLVVSKPFKGSLATGIHIGSSQEAVQQAYPQASMHQFPGATSFVEESPDRQYQLIIELRNRSVYRITVEKSLPSPTNW